MTSDYKKVFDPSPLLQDFRTKKEKSESVASDRRDGKLYQYNEEIILAINVAMATGRPLLVRGQSGSGKSSLAYNAARILGRRFYQFVVTSRIKSQDLLWRFDAVRRLGNAQARSFQDQDASSPDWHDYHPYIEPGILWWVFDPASARTRGAASLPSQMEAADTITYSHAENRTTDHYTPAVVLIDEIDKADPDFPNNLLVPFGSLEFRVEEVGQEIRLNPPPSQQGMNPFDLPLVIITTNEERRLPDAFLRRCIILELAGPTDAELVQIASASEGGEHTKIYEEIIRLMRAKYEEGDESDLFDDDERENVSLNVAEYLDAVRAYLRLKGAMSHQEILLENILNITSRKQRI